MRAIVFGSFLATGLAGAGLAVAALQAAELPASTRQMLAMTPQDFARTASVKDDALEVLATITTEPGYQERHGLLRVVWSDNFLRAFVDKSSGAVTYQLYQRIVYEGRLYKYFRTANYETPAGPRSVETLDLGRTEQCSRSQLFGGCIRTETLAVPLDAALLGTIATRYVPGNDAAWHFRFKAQSGEDYDGVMAPAEVAGLLAKVADYRRVHGLASR
jgi:hypothetical protein